MIRFNTHFLNIFDNSIDVVSKYNGNVKKIKEDEDGCMTLVINAVCDRFICDDAVITSELTVKFNEDSTFKYMGNKILNNGMKKIPEYQYRIKRKN